MIVGNIKLGVGIMMLMEIIVKYAVDRACSFIVLQIR